MAQGRTTTRSLIVWLSSALLLSFVLLAYPLYVIRPFRHQGSDELALALAVLRFRPIAQLCLVACALVLGALLWRRAQLRWQRVIAAVGALLVIAFAALSRVNIYERMFHPMDRPVFSSAHASTLGGREQVIAVLVGRVARAYPVRSMSYHHIVNDVLAGLPIVATY